MPLLAAATCRETERHQQAGDEASDMGHVGDAADIGAFIR